MVRVWLHQDMSVESILFPNADFFTTIDSGLSIGRREDDRRIEIARFAPGWIFAELVEKETEEELEEDTGYPTHYADGDLNIPYPMAKDLANAIVVALEHLKMGAALIENPPREYTGERFMAEATQIRVAARKLHELYNELELYKLFRE